MRVQNAPANIGNAGKVLLKENVTFVKSNRNRGVRSLKCENFQNRRNSICSRHVRSNSTKFEAQRSMKKRKYGRIKIRKMRALLKGKNPVKTEQGVMSLQNLLKIKRLSQESKSLLQTRAPTKEELLIKVTSLVVFLSMFVLLSDYFDIIGYLKVSS